MIEEVMIEKSLAPNIYPGATNKYMYRSSDRDGAQELAYNYHHSLASGRLGRRENERC